MTYASTAETTRLCPVCGTRLDEEAHTACDPQPHQLKTCYECLTLLVSDKIGPQFQWVKWFIG